jgi:two-component system, chemotaxis family, sensor kinase CheA
VTVQTTDPKDVFTQEAQDLLAQLEAVLLDLEQKPDDMALIDSAFRALHTIKGSGSMFGFEAVAAFTHHVETAFDRVRKGSVAPSRELMATALLAQDHMRRLIERPDAEDKAVGDVILAGLQRVLDEPVRPAAAPAPATEPAKQATWRIRMRLPRDVMANGTNPLLLLDELRELGAASITALTDDVPPLAEIDPAACYLGWDVVLTTAQPRQAIEDVFIFVRDEMTLEIEPIDTAGSNRRIGEILADLGYVEPQAVDAALAKQEPLGQILMKAGDVTPDKLASGLSAQRHLQREQGTQKPNAGSIRVPAERLDELMDRVGELVIAQSRLRQITKSSVDPQMTSVAEEIERLVLELRDTTMGIRMVPIGSLFGRFRRVVHDLSRDLGKQVELVMEGEETELDKTVIEQLNDPLVHLVRNAIDHGIEDPDVRVAAGKPRDGRIILSALHAGTEVLITVRDDGSGLDRERIRKRAIERGLLPANADIADGELFQVLFQPGFSTAETVTNLSGRGVGMDVVKRTVEALRSKIDIVSPPGDGTSVTLRLPLTLAIIDGLLVRVGTGRYVLPLGTIEECVELTASADAQARGRSFLNIRGELVPFMRLRELFAAKTPPDEFQKVVVVSSGELKVGLVVDQVIGDHQTVIKSLSKLHADIAMFSGATILGDGTVAIILDVPHLVEFGQVREERLKVAG